MSSGGGTASGGVVKKVSSCLWSVIGLVRGDWLAVFGAAWFLYILVPKASVPAVSCHGFMQGLDGPFPESLVIQLHSWLLVHSHTHTHTLTHSCAHFLVLQTCIYSVSHSLDHSLIHPFVIHPSSHPTVSQVPTKFSSETNKCVTCQQSIIGPFDLCRSFYPFVHSAVLLSSPSCFPFIRRLSTHSLVQSVFPTLVLSLYVPVVIPYLTLSSWSRTGDLKALWFLWLWNKGLRRAWDSGCPSGLLSVFLANEGKQTRSIELPAMN